MDCLAMYIGTCVPGCLCPPINGSQELLCQDLVFDREFHGTVVSSF